MRFNRAQLLDDFRRFLLPTDPGQYAPELGELWQPTISLTRGLETTPYGAVQGWGENVGRSAAVAAVALEFGATAVRPTPGSCFQLEKITISNDGAATATFRVKVCTAAAVAALGLTTNLRLVRMSVLSYRDGSLTTPQSSIELATGSHTAVPPSGGGHYLAVSLLAGENYTFDVPLPGMLLFGVDDETDRPWFVVNCETVNHAFTVAWVGRQWPMPI